MPLDFVIRACNAVERAAAAAGRAAAWLLVPLVLAVCLTVLAAQLRINVVADWGIAVPLFGERLTGNGLLDLQWHLFLILVMLGGSYALRTDAHVNVDILSARFGPRSRAAVRLVGDLLFLLPFCGLMAWFSWDFALRALATGEGSSYGGLADRWMIKMVLPAAFALFVVLGVARVVRSAAEILRPDLAPPPDAPIDADLDAGPGVGSGAGPDVPQPTEPR